MCQVEVVDNLYIDMVSFEVSCNMFATQLATVYNSMYIRTHIIEECENMVVGVV